MFLLFFQDTSCFFRFFHLYLEKYVVLILSEKTTKTQFITHIDHPCNFKSHWIFSEFSINVKLYHRFSQNQFFLFHTFFQTSWYRQFLSNCFKFEREIHKTQLHGMMRAFCYTCFRISVPCVRTHNLERKNAIFLLFHIIFFNIIYSLNPFIIPCSIMQ